jgi:sugar phosphate isomerase/epimerase
MNLLAVSQLSTLSWDFEQDVHRYLEWGFDGIGIYRRKLDDYGIPAATSLLQSTGMQVTSLTWAGGFTGSDGLGYEEAIDNSIDALHDAASIGAKTLVVITGGLNSHIKKHAGRVLIQALKELAQVAAGLDVTLSLEPIHQGCGESWSFIHDLKPALDLIEQVGHPSVGLACDLYHIGLGRDPMTWLPDIGPYLNLIQLGDGRHSPMGEMNRCLLGQGCVPLGAMLDRLLESGFEGPIEVELLGEDLEPLDYQCMLKHTREYLNTLFGFGNPSSV